MIKSNCFYIVFFFFVLCSQVIAAGGNGTEGEGGTGGPKTQMESLLEFLRNGGNLADYNADGLKAPKFESEFLTEYMDKVTPKVFKEAPFKVQVPRGQSTLQYDMTTGKLKFKINQVRSSQAELDRIKEIFLRNATDFQAAAPQLKVTIPGFQVDSMIVDGSLYLAEEMPAGQFEGELEFDLDASAEIYFKSGELLDLSSGGNSK